MIAVDGDNFLFSRDDFAISRRPLQIYAYPSCYGEKFRPGPMYFRPAGFPRRRTAKTSRASRKLPRGAPPRLARGNFASSEPARPAGTFTVDPRTRGRINLPSLKHPLPLHHRRRLFVSQLRSRASYSGRSSDAPLPKKLSPLIPLPSLARANVFTTAGRCAATEVD